MNTERSLSNEETRVKERALRGEIVLISPQGLKALDVQIEAVRQEVDVKTLELGLVAQQDTDLPENLGFKETKTHIQTTLAVKLHTLREMKAKSIPYWTKHENLVDFGTIFDAEVSVGDYIDSNRYILLGPAESLYVDMSKIGLTVLSYLSPLGRAVWGQPNVDGQETTYNAPDGSATCRIHKI